MINLNSDNSLTNFGFKLVQATQKNLLVKEVFSSVSQNYDLMNDLMSLGIHRIWKKTMLDMLGVGNGSLIDVASGTGDIAAMYMKNYIQNYNVTPEITITDYNENMLEVSKKKHNWHKYPQVKVIAADAANLPMNDMSFDNYSIAFGLRNMTDIQQVLKEANRVLRPAGKIVILEFSKVLYPLLERFYDSYSFTVIPFLGEMVAKNREAYQYLVESIRKFPDQDTLAFMMREEGFTNVEYRNLSGGIAAIHFGWK